MEKILCFLWLLGLSAEAGPQMFLAKELRVKFVKELHSILKQRKKSQGTLTYRYPGQIRIEQHRPFKTSYISNGKRAWLYSAPFDPKKEKGEVTVLNPQTIPITKVLDSLRRGLRSNKLYQVSQKGSRVTLSFNQYYRKKYQLEYVALELKHPKAIDLKSVSRLTIKGSHTTEHFELVEVDFTPTLPPGHFNFKITDKMKVTEAL